MPIEFRCPRCDKLLRTPDGTAGKQTRCPECGAIVPVPMVREPPTQPDAPASGPFADRDFQAAGGEIPYGAPDFYRDGGDPSRNRTFAIYSLVLGISGLVLSCCCPLLTLPLAITGLVLGIMARQSEQRAMATAGIALSIVALVLALLNAVLGAYLVLSGQHPMLQ